MNLYAQHEKIESLAAQAAQNFHWDPLSIEQMTYEQLTVYCQSEKSKPIEHYDINMLKAKFGKRTK